MLVGEAPGEREDEHGLPFVGPSGVLLGRLLARAEVPESALYICNAVKCRPPGNRNPRDDELRSCRRWLTSQVALVRPRVILTAGKVATSAVTATRGTMSSLLEVEGLTCFLTDDTIPVIPIYHPSYLLRRMDDSSARDVFVDTVARLRRAWQATAEA